MAVRRLARTVVEGGRTSGSKFNRRLLARVRRRNWQFDDDGEPFQKKGVNLIYREFADRLVVLRRWLESHIGQRWDDVYAKFCRENNRRTMKGWHIHDHLRYEVCCGDFRSAWYGHSNLHRAICLKDGTVQRGHVYGRYKTNRDLWPTDAEKNAARAFGGGRKVIVRGRTLFWTGGKYDPVVLDTSWCRQGHRLTPEETAKFWSFGKVLRDELTYVP